MKGWVVLSARALERVSHLMAERRLRDTEALARKAGSDERTIRRALRGERVQYRTVAEMAGALGADVQDLLDEDSTPVDGEIFYDWLRTGGRWGLWIAVAGSAASIAASARLRASPWATFLVQALTVLAVMAWQRGRMPKEFASPPVRVRLASTAALQFIGQFRRAWSWWAAFYSWFAAATFFPGLRPIGWPVLDALQNAGTLSLIACYEVLARRTVSASEAPRRSRVLFYGWCAIAALLALELAAATGPLHWEGAQRLFALASGLGQGIALALLAGRLDDPQVGAPSASILGLYTYACIQGTYAMFPDDSLVEHVLTVSALPLKCLLYLVVAWTAESGILWYFLARMRAADEVLIRQRRVWLRAYRDGAFRGPEFERAEETIG